MNRAMRLLGAAVLLVGIGMRANTAGARATSALGCAGPTALDRTVDRIYVTMLARCPDAGARPWARLAVATSGARYLGDNLAASAEGRRRLSRELTLIALSRLPTASEEESWASSLGHGTTGAALYATLLGGKEAVGKAGSVDAWLDQLPLTVLARPFTASERAGWATQLSGGRTPTQVAAALLATDEARAVAARTLVRIPATGQVDLTSAIDPTVASLVAAGDIARARSALAALVGAQPPVRVLLSGDSIPGQAAGYWRQALGSGVTAQSIAIGTFAACDERPLLAHTAALSRPDVIEISYIGNHATPCMAGVPADGVVARYRSDLLATFDDVRKAQAGVRFVLATPPPANTTGWYSDELAALDADLAAAPGDDVTVVDGRRDLTNADGSYAATLPCLPAEPECSGPVVAGVPNNVVREPGGIHLCSGPTNADLTCATWSAGAWRYARNLAGGAVAVL